MEATSKVVVILRGTFTPKMGLLHPFSPSIYGEEPGKKWIYPDGAKV